MTLGEIINRLEKEPPDLIMGAFAHPHSYRGVYAHLAFEPGVRARIGDSLNVLRSCVGRTFTGWKGGEYAMGLSTPCHFAFEGELGEEIGPLLLEALIALAKANLETP